MKFNITRIIMLAMLSTIGLLHAYPNAVFVKNDTDQAIQVVAYFTNTPQKPGAAQQLEAALLPYNGTRFGIAAPGWVATATGVRKMQASGLPLGMLNFDPKYEGSMYIIYSNSGLAIVSQQEWNGPLVK